MTKATDKAAEKKKMDEFFRILSVPLILAVVRGR